MIYLFGNSLFGMVLVNGARHIEVRYEGALVNGHALAVLLVMRWVECLMR